MGAGPGGRGPANDQEFRADLPGHGSREIRRRALVHRHGDAPLRMHPKNAATHSAELRPQSKTRSPGSILRDSNSRANCAASAGHFTIGPPDGPVTGAMREGNAPAMSCGIPQ